MQVSQSDLNEVLVAAEQDLRALQSGRVFLTGGTGYIGCWLLASLLHADAALALDIEVTVLSRDPQRFAERYPLLAKHASVELVQGDIRDLAFPAGRFTHVIHGATDVIAQQTPLQTFEVTVMGTRRVLDFARQSGAQRVLLMSSGAVYGKIPPHIDRIPEDYTGAPATEALASAYGIGKLATEWLGTAYGEPGVMSCSSARIFAQIGPNLALDKQFAAGNFLLNALRDEPFIIKGDGTPRRSYMYATDLVTWLLGILVRGRPGRAYNVGSDQGISIRELAVAIARETGRSPDAIQVLGMPAPGAAPDRYVPDVGRAASELGLRIGVPLDDAIRRTYDWYRSQQC
ncbi:NAD(P)-dependent oxidoreductase [Trinickia terrae]|uniref:NAD(P)-dependent oxidoreductase n=1 Tax=Trinickia terrae TaxID=2571161 RepID=A0A4U1IDS3_9BURK|nr:NAD(P)-dependent oxidoreductase [Trinickia terrae]TKC91823.1 NAD(P)-dependent oxidoreductase [Trinickia terrae]